MSTCTQQFARNEHHTFTQKCSKVTPCSRKEIRDRQATEKLQEAVILNNCQDKLSTDILNERFKMVVWRAET